MTEYTGPFSVNAGGVKVPVPAFQVVDENGAQVGIAANPFKNSTGGFTPRIAATDYALVSSASAYAAGQAMANNASAASVTPITLPSVARIAGGSGRLTGMRCTASAASGSLVTTLFDFDLYVFRPGTGLPFAAGSYPADRANCTFTAAALKELVGVFSFGASGWKQGVAGAAAYQAVGVNGSRPYASFNLASVGGSDLIAFPVAVSAWTPGAVVQTLSFTADVDQD